MINTKHPKISQCFHSWKICDTMLPFHSSFSKFKPLTLPSRSGTNAHPHNHMDTKLIIQDSTPNFTTYPKKKLQLLVPIHTSVTRSLLHEVSIKRYDTACYWHLFLEFTLLRFNITDLSIAFIANNSPLPCNSTKCTLGRKT